MEGGRLKDGHPPGVDDEIASRGPDRRCQPGGHLRRMPVAGRNRHDLKRGQPRPRCNASLLWSARWTQKSWRSASP